MNTTSFAGSLDVTAIAGNIEELLARLRQLVPRSEHVKVGNQALIQCSPAAGAVTARGDILALVVGAALWADAELAEIARAQGTPASLCAAYGRYGLRCLEHIRGSFALAVVDHAQRTVFAAIDRAGVHSMYFADQQERFLIGSSPQIVAKHPRLDPTIDPQAVYNYMYSHVVPAPGSIYKGVRKLLPAQYVVWRDGRTTCGFYWHLKYVAKAEQPLAQLEHRFRSLLDDSVAQSVKGSAKVGTFLSGGTDSSTITGVLARQQRAPVDAYSIGFNAAGFDEMSFARIAAERYKVAHHPYYVTPADVAQVVPLIARTYAEPFGNASTVPTYCCALRAAEDGVERLLAGDGGDEIFGGNARYAKQRIFEVYSLFPAWLRTALIEPVLIRDRPIARLPLLRKAASYVRQATIPLPDRLEAYNLLQRVLASAIFEPAFLAQIDPDQPAQLAREVYGRAASSSAIDRMMHLDLKVTLADNDLRKVSGMCEAAGVQVRYPLLSDAMLDFSGEIPAHLKVKGLRLRYFFKRALRDFLPYEIIAKKKHGFGLPFGLWMQSDPVLKELACESLQSFARRGYVQPQYLDSLLAMHQVEHASYYGVMIWVIMMLEQWFARQQA